MKSKNPTNAPSSGDPSLSGQAVIDALTGLVCVVDETGLILAVNAAWSRFARDNTPGPGRCFLGENYLSVCDRARGPSATEASAFAAGLRAVLAGQRTEFRLEYPCDGPGERQWFVARVTRCPGTSPVRAVVAHGNISERKRLEQERERTIAERKAAEETLRHSELRYRRLFEVESDALFLVDRETGCFVDANSAALTLYGYRREELLRLRNADISAEPEKTRQAVAGGETNVPLRWHRKRDGTVFPVEIAGSYFEYQGRQIHVAAIRDITLRKKAEQELRASQEQLRALAARLQTAREEERTHVAREIHDVLAQELTRLKIDLVWLQGRLAKPGKPTSPEALAGRLTEMGRAVDAAIHSVQRIATELRPVVLDTLGLSAAVEWQAREFQTRHGIQCQASLPQANLLVDRDCATAAFRILQESLTNVLRHAHATRVEIRLVSETGQLRLRVQDNGCGIGPGTLSNPSSIGLAGMRERALLLGGQFEVRSQPGTGTAIDVSLPLSSPRNLPQTNL